MLASARTYPFTTPPGFVVAAIIGMALGAVLSIATYRRTRRTFDSLATSVPTDATRPKEGPDVALPPVESGGAADQRY